MISVVIPCFNSGEYLQAAIESVINSGFDDYEIVVVDDGSTDPMTIRTLERIKDSGIIKLIRIKNVGAASARNIGVNQTAGDFLLFLDSDNRIKPDYLVKSFKAIENNPEIGVVYSKPQFFGMEEFQDYRRFEVKDYSQDSLFAGNYIDMCSLVRKSAFLQVGGFDESTDLYFGEDWDLWIRISHSGWKFQFLEEVLFEYRIRKGSLMDHLNSEKRQRTLEYLGGKHGALIYHKYRKYFRIMDRIQKHPFRYFFKVLYYKYFLGKPLIK